MPEHKNLRVLRLCAAREQSQPGHDLAEDQIQQSYPTTDDHARRSVTPGEQRGAQVGADAERGAAAFLGEERGGCVLGEQSLPSVVGKPSKWWRGRACGTAKTVSASWLASAGFDGEVRIWNPISDTAHHTLTGHTPEVRALAAAPNGSWLASAGYGGEELRIWNPTTGAALTSLRVAGQLSHLLLVSTTIAAAGEGGLYLLTLCHRLPIPTDTLIDQA